MQRGKCQFFISIGYIALFPTGYTINHPTQYSAQYPAVYTDLIPTRCHDEIPLTYFETMFTVMIQKWAVSVSRQSLRNITLHSLLLQYMTEGSYNIGGRGDLEVVIEMVVRVVIEGW